MVAAAFALAFVSGCASPIPPTWSLTGVVNTPDGIVVVWRRAEYIGGEFNGFDRNPILISRATYRAFGSAEAGTAFRTKPLTVNYSYEHEEQGTPHPEFLMRGNQLLVDPCMPSSPAASIEGDRVGCADSAQTGISFVQLGWRREPVLGSHTQLILLDPAKRPECRLDLKETGEDAAVPFPDQLNGARFGVAYFPAKSLTYVVDNASKDLDIYASVDCEKLKRIASLKSLAGFDGPSVQRHSFEVVDVAPTEDPYRPRILAGWNELSEGIYRQRFGVFSLADQFRTLPQSTRVMGFWASRSSHVLTSVEGEVQGGTGIAMVTLYDLVHSRLEQRRASYSLQ